MELRFIVVVSAMWQPSVSLQVSRKPFKDTTSFYCSKSTPLFDFSPTEWKAVSWSVA